MTRKLRVGFFGITGCAGCQLSVIFNEDDLLPLFGLVDVTAFPFIREKNAKGEFDYVFIEGLVASNEDREKITGLRQQAANIVALGACAHTGCVPAYRKYTLPEDYEHLLYAKKPGISDVPPQPIDAFIKVDYTIPGCPPSKQEILSFITDIANGKKPKPYNNPVCIECRRNNNACLLESGKPCLGPVTAGGCDSVCINGGLECWGCRGPTKDANVMTLVRLLESKGHSRDFIKKRLRAFAGLKIPKNVQEALDMP